MLIHLYIVLAVANKIYNMSNYLNLAKKHFLLWGSVLPSFREKNHLTARYVQFYAISMSKMEALDDGDLSTEEALYYAEVTNQISKKLIEVAQ